MEATVAQVTDYHKILSEDFEWIMRNHQQRIYRILLLMLRDPEDANNLTQECFLRAFSRRSGFRGEAALGTWLVRIAINLARDQLKSGRVSFWKRLPHGKENETQTLPDRGSTPEDPLLMQERLAAVWSVVESLPLKQRTVFTLRFG